MSKRHLLIVCILIMTAMSSTASAGFVSVKGNTLFLDGKPYYFIGANYWYGSLLGVEKDKQKGIRRLRRELDFLKANGVDNLRLMAGAESSGLLNGVIRVGPPLQPEAGRFDERVAEGLDLVLHEMSKRSMKAVIFFSNNWEWSGGFQQYLIWSGYRPAVFREKRPTWDELRDIVAEFYSCSACNEYYRKQVDFILSRTNKFNGKGYLDDPTIMAWEMANEPRPMRPAANHAYRRWMSETAAYIKKRDPNHLVTTGHEGWIGTQDVELYQNIHDDRNIDYLTIHIWPKNWGWYSVGKMADEIDKVIATSDKYIDENAVVAARLRKPLVIEEFGLPRDGTGFDPSSSTRLRDRFFKSILSSIGDSGGGKHRVAGANFWAFAGFVKPRKGQVFWKPGDPYIGDPPMEEQGLNSVFASDVSTWRIIREAKRLLGRQH
jgi:mannan endo-1,4-beta-mannosidase